MWIETFGANDAATEPSGTGSKRRGLRPNAHHAVRATGHDHVTRSEPLQDFDHAIVANTRVDVLLDERILLLDEDEVNRAVG